MAEPSSDVETFRWIIGVVVTGLTAFLGHIYKKFNSLEARLAKHQDSAREEVARAENRIWEGLEAHRKVTSAFQNQVLSSMVTKEDLRDALDRLLERHSRG